MLTHARISVSSPVRLGTVVPCDHVSPCAVKRAYKEISTRGFSPVSDWELLAEVAEGATYVDGVRVTKQETEAAA